MQYKLFSKEQSDYSTVEQILINRGLKKEDIFHYLNTTDEDINEPIAFGEKVLNNGVQMLISHIQAENDIFIIVDADCDGYTSAALLINFLYDLFPTYAENHIKYYIHQGKQHGLSDCINEALKYKMVICPDSSSNDYEYHKILWEQKSDVLVLDHHEADSISEYACVINNQLSDYPNKELSGVGVVWQFCRYINFLIKGDYQYANNYLDLVALGLTADMMSLLSLETKHLILKGFKEENIKNPFIYGMAQKNNFSLGEHISPMGAAFYIAPFVNAMVRSGTQEEKEILFKSMLNHEAFKMILSNKRGHKLGEEEKLIDQALRVATNVKNRQTKAQDNGMILLEKKIEEQHLLDHKVLLFLLEPGEIDKNIAGLIANKFMAKYQRPCCILTKVINNEKEVSYQGSARGYDASGITNFKDICNAAGAAYAEGHQGAFGLGLDLGKMTEDSAEVFGELIYQFLDNTDIALKEMSSEPIYSVDYIYNGENVNPQNIIDISNMEDLWGKDMPEPYVAIKNLKVTKDMVTLMSPDKKPTLKITLPNKVALIKFNSSQEEYEKFISETGYIQFDIIGRCNKNVWNGYTTAQIFIEDYEETGRNKYIF